MDDGDENKFSVDKGGYWVGTDKSLNASIAASVLRQSIVNVRGSHPDELRAMQERFPGVGTHDLVRFLQAREFNVANAGDMLEAHEAWRRETLPIPYESVRDTIATRKFYVLDDKDGGGRPVLFFCLHRFMDAPYVVEDEIRALLYLLEGTVSRKMGNSFETQKWSVFIDVSGIRSPPLQFLQKMNSVMEANYPERLYRTVLFPVPFWLQKVISACVTFMAEETRNKFAYVNDIRSLEEYAMMPVEKMGLDVNDMVKSKRLK